jgi:hypothetical protein
VTRPAVSFAIGFLLAAVLVIAHTVGYVRDLGGSPPPRSVPPIYQV